MRPSREESLTDYLVDNQTGLYRLAYSYLQNREDALDAVQTAACRALERQDSLRDPGAMRPWVTRILVNACMDLLRQRRQMEPFDPERLDTGSYEDPMPEDGTLAQRVNGLPPEVQTVIKLRFYQEMSLQEISAVTGTALSTVKSRLYSGLRKLRVSMEGVELT